MVPESPIMGEGLPRDAVDEELFGWDPTPGIVSVWADRDGRAVIWQRQGERVTWRRERFRPWVFAATLADLVPVRGQPGVTRDGEPGSERAAISYRELDGPEGSYRYLISARSGRLLERTLLAGAERRLGRRPGSLYDLDDEYYRVGPVEQYLMQTGRVYFRGLTYEALHRLQFDLETTALDPGQGRIFLVAVRDTRGLETILEAPTPEDEPGLIADLCALIRERDPDVIENHNLFGFDLPFLEARAALHGVPLVIGRPPGPPLLERYEEYPGSRYARYSVAGRELIDTLDAVRRHDFVVRDLPSHRLKDVARAFGLASEDRTYLAGAELFATYRDDPESVRRYAYDDVREVDGLSRRLLGATFALAQMAPRRYERLSAAGPAMGILEPILVRAYLRAGAALPRASGAGDDDSGPHEGGALYLFATGVAERVVKADIASLYPSLMRTYGIGPASDRLGVLLRVVGRLTDLRLAHKMAARSAPPGSLEEGYHNAMQAAMKLLINSAYGYMGAGSMALFADRNAADEVTRRGRELLGEVVRALRERGTALIEADTDGVFFAVPPGWLAEQEEALVAEIAATLPDGIRLEYEGRYRAMFSHEVKNYALLTYEGDLIVRGVALRSSRAEPFGERFLREALRHTMRGDTPALRAAFLRTARALRERTFGPADVATRVRLSKTPEAYLASRATHREPAYEALLAAGRTTWAPGEQVRYYRAFDGTYVWLPDESGDHAAGTPLSAGEVGLDPPDYDVEHYLDVLVASYAARLRKAFEPHDFEQLFRLDGQLGLFDRPIEQIQPRWIRCPEVSPA